MAHIINNSATVLSNTGNSYTNVYVMHSPIITPETISTGKIPIKLFFFSNKEAMTNGFRNITPLIAGKEVNIIQMPVTPQELEELIPLKFSQFVHKYLSDAFGFWNTEDEQYGNIETQLNITEDFIVELNEFQKIIGIQITNNSEEELETVIADGEETTIVKGMEISLLDEADNVIFTKTLLPQEVFEFKELLTRKNYSTFLLTSNDWSNKNLKVVTKREQKIIIEL